jgi:hypothetical protein
LAQNGRLWVARPIRPLVPVVPRPVVPREPRAPRVHRKGEPRLCDCGEPSIYQDGRHDSVCQRCQDMEHHRYHPTTRGPLPGLAKPGSRTQYKLPTREYPVLETGDLPTAEDRAYFRSIAHPSPGAHI